MEYFTLRQKLRLARSLFTKTSPAYVQYYITARCNLACEQCNIIYGDADVDEMNIAQVRAMAANLAEIGVCIVLLIGGEPFVRRDLPLIVQAFTDVGIHVRLQTNGLATSEQIEACVEAGAHDISISLDSLNGSVQDKINGGYRQSWERAIETIAKVNRIFPENGTAFFGTVLMPRNLFDIRDVIEFATEIGWGVSLVPAHTTTQDRPQAFRTFDDAGVCRFPPEMYSQVSEVLADVKALRKKGYNVYDSDEYLDDIYRFIVGEPIQWRSRNHDVCDSPSLYFAIEPNGDLKPCCDFKMDEGFAIYDRRFPEWYRSGIIHDSVHRFTRSCSGCMYGSYPEITITARYLRSQIRRLRFFNSESRGLLRALTGEEMIEVARRIHGKNSSLRIEQNRSSAL